VVKILQELNLDMLRRTLVFNKCDRIPPAEADRLCRRYQAIGVCALHPDTLHPLLDHLDRELAGVALPQPTSQVDQAAALASRL
jgi:GTP-binding protein HflX